jgi:hypothetical protein
MNDIDLIINKKKKAVRTEFLIARATKAEKASLVRRSGGNMSKLIRVNLGLQP